MYKLFFVFILNIISGAQECYIFFLPSMAKYSYLHVQCDPFAIVAL